jgi:glycosyltransferase involved in cell wall biosynthesis
MAKYSIVVPFHNEEENVTVLYARLKQVMEQVGESFELVLVDDGSNDRTYKLMGEIAAVDSRVLVIKLRRNFGQTSALAAGFDHATGEFILAMDGDLQHDPSEIPNFWKSSKKATTWSPAGARSGLTVLSCAAFPRAAPTG